MSEVEATSCFTPPQMLEKTSAAGITKSSLRFLPLLLLSILAGMYIAFGGVFSTVIATGTNTVLPYGIVKLLQGLAFSLGLILVVVGGAELFTGNMLMIIPFLERKIDINSLLRNWLVVYIGNFAGSLVVALLIISAGSYQLNGGLLGTTMLSIADAKMHYSFFQAVSLGILCNVLVCLAVWISYSARNTADKIISIIFPISAFIAAGFEHSVANMYLIPVALMLKNLDPGFVTGSGLSLSALTWGDFFLHNLLPVTLGNMVGGVFFVGVAYFLAYHRNDTNNDSKQSSL